MKHINKFDELNESTERTEKQEYQIIKKALTEAFDIVKKKYQLKLMLNSEFVGEYGVLANIEISYK